MDDLKYIKKHYSESLAHICRSLFPTLLETEGLLSQVLEKSFAHSSALGDDLKNSIQAQDNFKDYIYSLINVEKQKPELIQDKTPFELMEEAGYILFPECLTEEDIQSYRHFFYRGENNGPTPVYKNGELPKRNVGEELCTFSGNRLDYCRVWFAVKKEVLEGKINREDFKNPSRQDEYGTSVISIQFSKTKNPTLSIKNRYNHTVNNPDATFSNNLENIFPGLTQAFAKKFNLNLDCTHTQSLNVEDYRMADDGKFYRQNCEVDNVVYCENNVIIDNGHLVKLDDTYTLLDNYIFDRKNMRVMSYEEFKGDSSYSANKLHFPFIYSIGNVKGFDITKAQNGERVLTIKKESGEDVLLTYGKHNQILGIHDPNLTQVYDWYLSRSKYLRDVSLPNVKEIGERAFYFANSIKNLYIPQVEKIKYGFLSAGSLIHKLDLPNLKSLGGHCFNGGIFSEVNVPFLKSTSDYCFCDINSPASMGYNLFSMITTEGAHKEFERNPIGHLRNIAEADASIVEQIKNFSQNTVTVFNAPSLESIGARNFKGCYDLRVFNAPNLMRIGGGSFAHCANEIEFNSPYLNFKNEVYDNPTGEERVLLEKCIQTVKDYQSILLGKPRGQTEEDEEDQDDSCPSTTEDAEQN